MGKELIDALKLQGIEIPDFSNKPAVALETTIITHGMPYPNNVATALACEEEIRRAGGIPVTMGIIKGEIKFGLTPDEIESLGKNHDDVVKVSRHNIGYVLANKLSGATTVAATMMLAKLANIKVFATGGIGGVHRGAQQTFDISADLEEFSKSPINVVCAGPKAILDIPLTLEYLETKGVPVIGYKTKTLPMFYTSHSSYKLTQYADDVSLLARIIKAYDIVANSNQGTLIVNPVPEKYSLDPEYIEKQVEKACQKAESEGIRGAAITPYLLNEMLHLTSGKSLETNQELVKNNSHLAGLLAVELCK